MTVLRLAIDAAGMRAGAQQAEQALRQIDGASQRTVTQVDQVNRAIERTGDIYGAGSRVFVDAGARVLQTGQNFQQLNRAVAATGEALQISQRVRLVGEEFRQLGTGMGSVSQLSLLVAQGLLDVVQVSDRLRQARLAELGSDAAKGFGGLLSVLRANPLLLAATAIGAIASAMSLFGRETARAADSQKALNDLIDEGNKLRFQAALEQRTGSGPGFVSAADQARQLQTAAGFYANQTGQVNARDLAQILGVPFGQFRDTAGGNLTVTERRSQATGVGGNTRLLGTDYTVSAGFAQEQVEQRLRELSPALQAPQQAIGPSPASREALDDYLGSLQQESYLLGLSEEKRQASIALFQAESIARQQGIALSEQERTFITEQIGLQQQLIEARQLGSETFAAVGAGLFQAATGAASFRQALAGIVQQLAQIAQSRFVQQFANFGASLFGSTTGQLRDPGVGGVGGLRVGESGPTVPSNYVPA